MKLDSVATTMSVERATNCSSRSRVSAMLLLYRLLRQPSFRIDGRHASRPRGRDRLAVVGVGHVARGAKAIGVSGNRRDTYRLSYHWWQGVWDVGFRIICEDEDPAPEQVAAAE